MTYLQMVKKAFHKEIDEVIEYLPKDYAENLLSQMLEEMNYSKRFILADVNGVEMNTELDDADLVLDRLLGAVIDEEGYEHLNAD